MPFYQMVILFNQAIERSDCILLKGIEQCSIIMETRNQKRGLCELRVNKLQEWDRLNQIDTQVRLMKQEYKETDASSRTDEPKNYALTQLSTRLKGKINELYQQERYATFEPSLAELKSLLGLMEALSATEHLFCDSNLRQEVHNSEGRLRRTRAGNRLKELIKEAAQLAQDKAEVFVEETEIDKEFEKHLSDIPQNWSKTAKNFVKAKLINEKIIESQFTGKTAVNFNVKYSRLDNYFWNKYQMCRTFVGEELKDKEDRRRTILADNLQLKQARALYQIAGITDEKKPIKEPNKFRELANEIETVIKNNLQAADKLLMRVYESLNLQVPEPEDYHRRTSSPSETEGGLNENKKIKTLPTLRKHKTIHTPGVTSSHRYQRVSSPYTRKNNPFRMTANMFQFPKKFQNSAQTEGMSANFNKNRFNKRRHERRSCMTTKMHDYFEEAEEVIQSISRSENTANRSMITTIRKLLLSSVEMKLQSARKMKSPLKEIVSEIDQLWCTMRSQPRNSSSIFEKLNGSSYKA